MSMPVGLQLRRTRGWRLPAGAVSVARPSRWGNPNRIVRVEGGFAVSHVHSGASIATFPTRADAAEVAVSAFRAQLLAEEPSYRLPTIDEVRRALAGHDLACYCALGDPCHRDVLLAIANGERD